MRQKMISRGPWAQRLAINLLSIVLAILVYWLIGFLLSDIKQLPGPVLNSFEAKTIDPNLKSIQQRLEFSNIQLQRQINDLQQRRTLVESNINNTQSIIRQLLSLQQKPTDKNSPAKTPLIETLQQNTRVFINQQNQLQQINTELSQLQQKHIPLQNEFNEVSQQLAKANQQAFSAYQLAVQEHFWKTGLIQIGLLLIILSVAGTILIKNRQSVYLTIWQAISIAILIKIFFVIHYYFSSRYFKYILAVALISIVIKILSLLLKHRANPEFKYLLKQYREAYERFLCPICEFPIRIGPLKYLFWTRRSIKKLCLTEYSTSPSETYICPHCGTHLYQSCAECHHIRHTLLPYCEHCGAQNNQIKE